MWWLWVIVALAAAVAEIAVSGLVLGGVAGAAIVAAIFSLFLPGILPGAIVFAAVSVLYLITLRPAALNLLTGQSPLRLGPQGPPALVAGRRGVVTKTVTPDGGQIRIGQGEFWSARSYDGKEIFPEGTTVEVALVEGVTALVWEPAG